MLSHRTRLLTPLLLSAALATLASVASAQSPGWTPPLGIPAPEFGIVEVAPPPPNPWNVETPGFYYVDSTHPNASDAVTYGTPSAPRKSIPRSVPAGSVVEVRGATHTPLPSNANWFRLSGTGTPTQPIFFRGDGQVVIQGRRARVSGQYVVVEGFVFDRTTISVFGMGSHHIAIRNLELKNVPALCGTKTDGAPKGCFTAMVSAGKFNSDVVIYNNHIHHNGDPDAPYENDVHGVTAHQGTARIWIVDNHIHHNGGDSVQINSTVSGVPADLIYIGRNRMHDEGENAIDVKAAARVVISQNEMYAFERTVHLTGSGSDGSAVVIHTGPAATVWMLFNHIYQSVNGIRNNGSPTSYVIGNVIHNIHHDPARAYDPASAWAAGHAIIAWATQDLYVEHNTIYNVDGGISYPGGGSGRVHVRNNVIAGVTQPSHHVAVTSRTVSAGSDVASGLFQPSQALGGESRFKWSSTGSSYGLSGFRARFGQCGRCVEGDPLFVDAAGGDLRLRDGSPAAGSALDSSIYATFQDLYGFSIAVDFTGRPRPVTGAAMGAYEPGASALPLSAPRAPLAPPAPSDLQLVPR